MYFLFVHSVSNGGHDENYPASGGVHRARRRALPGSGGGPVAASHRHRITVDARTARSFPKEGQAPRNQRQVAMGDVDMSRYRK